MIPICIAPGQRGAPAHPQLVWLMMRSGEWQLEPRWRSVWERTAGSSTSEAAATSTWSSERTGRTRRCGGRGARMGTGGANGSSQKAALPASSRTGLALAPV